MFVLQYELLDFRTKVGPYIVSYSFIVERCRGSHEKSVEKFEGLVTSKTGGGDMIRKPTIVVPNCETQNSTTRMTFSQNVGPFPFFSGIGMTYKYLVLTLITRALSNATRKVRWNAEYSILERSPP